MSDKFANEAAGDQTSGLIESYTRLKFSITRFNAQCNMIYVFEMTSASMVFRRQMEAQFGEKSE